MGEWSRTVGESGEKIVQLLFNKIGWGTNRKNTSIPCVHGVVHKEKKKIAGPRTTHGIDMLFSYACPLFDGVLQNVLSSVKYSAKAYPKSPTDTFKRHLTDLANTTHCFKRSAVRRGLFDNVESVDSVEDSGVIFWLTNKTSDDKRILGEELESVQIPVELEFETVYLVDNNQAAFLFDSIYFLENKYADCDTTFLFHDTGKNNNALTKRTSGLVLPVQLVTSKVIAVRARKRQGEETSLVLFANAPFTGETFARMFAMALSLSRGWATNIRIGFSSFDPTADSQEVQSVKMKFSEESSNLEVFCYHVDFRNSVKD